MIFLSFLTGAIHVLAPDHWVPGSVLAWQKSWRFRQTAAFSALIFIVHLLLGLLIYFLFHRWLDRVPSRYFLPFAGVLVLGFAWLRSMRFSRIREILGAGPSSIWGWVTVFSLLGPSESLIPILMKSKVLGSGYTSAFLAYGAGTLVSAVGTTLFGRWVWERPQWLPWGIQWAQSRMTLIPFTASLAVGLAFLLRIS